MVYYCAPGPESNRNGVLGEPVLIITRNEVCFVAICTVYINVPTGMVNMKC